MMEKRIYNLDNVKVILMLLVIIGHTLLNSYGDDSIEYIRFICRCFTMPLFTFISGYLTKKEQAFWKNVKYLLYPCLLFTVVNDILQIWLLQIMYFLGNNQVLQCGIYWHCLYIVYFYLIY